MPKISLIASSTRPWLWDEFFSSLWRIHIDIEIIFSGNLNNFQVRPYLERYPKLKYIHTSDCIPPAQCYEIARRFSKGEYIMWVADDCEFDSMLLESTYDFIKKLPNNYVLSIKTREDNLNSELEDHTFFGFNRESPQMAPIALINREYLNNLGGFDCRYLCGQYENDVIMRVYESGGSVIKYKEQCVYIEHLKKHGRGSKFWKGYAGDREILEKTWAIGEKVEPPIADNNYGVHLKLNGLQPPTIEWPIWIDKRKVSLKSQMGFFPYSDKDLLTVSQCNRPWPTKE